ncbi:MAG TPA: hypothetical protein VK112_01455 [Fodinibius sp.]|nr:hypothetical protein [Fodinibius sp.]
MLDRLILKYLTQKGKIAYYVGQVVLIGLWALYLFGIAGYSLEEGEMQLWIGLIVIVISWAGICYLVWKKPDKEEQAHISSERLD